jgi:hypothetical protein
MNSTCKGMDPVEEGKRHCLAYGSEYRNPYPPGTDAHNQFERGWSQTLKKYPHTVARIDKKSNEKNERRQ